MRGRTKIAAVGPVATTLLCVVSSTAGAGANTWSVQSTGGSDSLNGLAGLLLIGRRRVASVAHSLGSSNRRRGGSRATCTDPTRITRRPATGPGLRDLLRSPSGLGGRPGDSHKKERKAADRGTTDLRRIWRGRKQMQREPMLRAARNGTAESRSEQWQPAPEPTG